MKKLSTILFALLVSITAACVEDTPTLELDASPPTTINETEGPADRVNQWHIRHTDTSFWFQNAFKMRKNQWKFEGRASRNISKISSKFENGDPVITKLISKRKFQVFIDAQQLVLAAKGERIFTTIETSKGNRFVSMRFAPRLKRTQGDKEVYVLPAMNAIFVGSDLRFRGRTSLRSGWELQHVRAENYAELKSEPRLTPFEFSADELPRILRTRKYVVFTANDGNQNTSEKRVSFHLRLIQLSSSELPPRVAWPKEPCQTPVRECLRTLDDQDFEKCGYANQVEACWVPHAVDFSHHLEAEISFIYDRDERKVAGRNGRTKASALSEISPNKIGMIDPFESEDAATYDGIVVYHPGVIYRRSSTLWQGYYNEDGNFEIIEKVN